MKTLFLLPSTWDIQLNADGDIALAKDPYSRAQDVASAIRLFDGELWYDTTQGVPHFDEALGGVPSLALYRHSLETAALRVNGVQHVKVSFDISDKRILAGNVYFVDQNNIDWVIKL